MKSTGRKEQVERLAQAIAAIENSTLSPKAKERGLVPLRKALNRELGLAAQGR
ncbi:MAG: hypothetical protein GX030_04200 [Firmicutes bacterium]|nr:hypothetical protein [Bacillota bacterium]